MVRVAKILLRIGLLFRVIRNVNNYCFLLISAAYASFVKYKWSLHTHPNDMKFYRATPLDV